MTSFTEIVLKCLITEQKVINIKVYMKLLFQYMYVYKNDKK